MTKGLAITLLALPLIAASPERHWYRVTRGYVASTVYIDRNSIRRVGTHIVADELTVPDVRDDLSAVRARVEFDCVAHTAQMTTYTPYDLSGEAERTYPMKQGDIDSGEKSVVMDRLLAFACDPESSDVPAVEDPLHDERGGEAPAVD